jgi:hypothetical protein
MVITLYNQGAKLTTLIGEAVDKCELISLFEAGRTIRERFSHNASFAFYSTFRGNRDIQWKLRQIGYITEVLRQ